MKAIHTVIRASAGSGKTFQLTNRLIWLLLSGEEPTSILATTFTRKAAGEIIGRLLTRLADAAVHEDLAQSLAQQIGLPDLRSKQVFDLLSQLASRIHSLRIGTLDSVFQSLASIHA
jgi:ATP-dependent exoDNAse (exonuclease V) beta subunit